MSSLKKVILKPGKQKALLQRHPWIFSGAVTNFPDFENGEILVSSAQREPFSRNAIFTVKIPSRGVC